VGLVDANGTKAATYAYDPYGTTRTATGPQATANPFRYIGGYLDPSGLYKLGARYYDSALGRFTQQDPAGQRPNLYIYAGGNPVNNTDPTGLFSLGEIFAGAGLITTTVLAVALAPVVVPVAAVAAGASVLIGAGAIADGSGVLNQSTVIDGTPQVGCYPENGCY